MKPSHWSRMTEGTKLLLWAIALGVGLTLLFSFVDVESWWQAEVVGYEITRL